MEGSDIYRASNSLRARSSTVWRNSGVEVFSKSSREEDDEEALKWAALEKLPTYNRLRKGLLTASHGVANEIDVTDLGFQERHRLLERLVKVAEEDNEKFLLKLKERIDRVGLDVPTIEVRYEHLNIEAEAFVGSRALPSFINSATNVIEGFLNFLHILPSKKKHVTILKDVSGIVKPRRMTLLLGPPSSGKTTLLLALSGKLDKSLQVSGRVTYNGHTMNEFVPQRTAAYISQHDVHIGEMTVRETLAFSARCQGVGSRYDLLSELSRREKAANIKPDPDIDVYMKATAAEGQESSIVTDYTLKILGLDICADTMVGDEMLRGISGGQRKRVTTGEMLIPVTIVEVAVWVFLTYYVIGFDPNVGRFFKQYLVLLFISQMASGLFRAIAALGRNMIVANTFGSFAVLTLLALGGFILSRKDIKSWWIWGYWISPLMYGQNAMMVNEFLGHSWHNATNNLGVQYLDTRGFFTDSYWYWLGFGALVGFVFLFNMMFGFALEFLGREYFSHHLYFKILSEMQDFINKYAFERAAFDKPQASITEEEPEADTPNDRTVAEVELPRRESSDRSDAIAESSHGNKKGMVLPFEPHSITFDDIIYSVDMPQEMKEQGVVEDKLVLLKGVSGAFRPGVLTALMGMFIEEVMELVELNPLRNSLSIEGVSKIKDGYNPATWMLEVTTTAQELSLGVDFTDLYKNSDLYSTSRQDLLNALGSMHTSVLFLGVQNSSSVQPVVAVERTVFYREKAAGMYSALPYAFAQILVELPYIFAQAVTYGVIVYAMIGFDWTAEKFFWYLFFMYFTLLYFTFYGMMAVAVTPNHHVASIVAAAFYAIWNLFSGFVVPRPSIPVWWRWYYWACPVAWTIYGLVASQFGDIMTEMSSEGQKPVKYFLEDYFGIKHDFIGVCAVVVAGIAVLFAFIFAVAIKAFNFQKR
ncbi:hypothetical protein VNO77_29359 [Canavalia gladiata]|uniref:Uncharacterized protein n=1 Tax=Canavalia gladiata TaxID=3824 RepID=A0AAN9KXM6_CANGL